MMTSHLCAASVLRTKPGVCGYQLYESPLPSLLASNSASLFSKPSPRSVENGGANPEHLGIDEFDRPIRAFHRLREQFSRRKDGRDRRACNAQAQPQPLAVGGT